MKAILLASLCLFSINAFAQEPTDLTDVMAKETCECIQQKKTENADPEKITEALGLCIVNSYFKHEQEAQKQFGITAFDEKAGEIIGEKIGVKMLKYCPDVILSLSGDSEEEEVEESPNIVLSGKIQSIEEGEFISYKLKDAENKVHKITWLTFFEGSDEYEKNPKALVGKNVTVTVYELDFYFAKSKVYSPVKQILELVIQK